MAITAPSAQPGPRLNSRMSAGVSLRYSDSDRFTRQFRSSRVERSDAARQAVRRERRQGKRRGGNGLRYTTAAAVGFVAAFFVLFLPGMDAQADLGVVETPAASVVTVEAGDSLWSVASRVLPDTDPRTGIDLLQEANGLSGTDLVPGQQLVVPGR